MCGGLSVAGTKGPIGQQHTQAHPLNRPGRALPQQTYINEELEWKVLYFKKKMPKLPAGVIWAMPKRKGVFFWEVFPFATRGNAKMY